MTHGGVTFLFLVAQVEKGGARRGYGRTTSGTIRRLFYQKMPKSVVQSNWYYDAKFDPRSQGQGVPGLEEHGYDQIPTGSNYYNSTNFGALVQECRKSLSPGHLLGFLQTPWKGTLEKHRQRHMEAVEEVAQAMKSSG